jgi:hypothetical protein
MLTDSEMESCRFNEGFPMSNDPSRASPYLHSPITVAQAFVDGRAMGEASLGDEAQCPYPEGGHEHDAWHRGFRLGHSQMDGI